LYAAGSTPSGEAIFKSADGGQSWGAVNTSIPVASSLLFNPANSSTIYAATFSGGVFLSTDAGTNWSDANNGLRVLGIHVLAGDPTDSATLYAGGDEGLFKSTDSAGSWKQQAVFLVAPAVPGSVRSLLIDFTNPNILYAETMRGGCVFNDTLLFKSTDGGATWSNSISPDNSGCLISGGLMRMDPTDPNTLYLGEFASYVPPYALLKSVDGGGNWNSTGPLLDTRWAMVLVIDPTAPANLYAGTDIGLFQSSDDGATWTSPGWGRQTWTCSPIDPLRPNILYASTSGLYPETLGFKGMFKSVDRGASWSPINVGLGDVLDAHASIAALVLDPVHTDTLYAATSGYGVFRSSDGGANWAPMNDGLTYLDVQVLAIAGGAPTTVYAGTRGGVFKLVDDGT
jgi:photosystem II stability/assembly factor-like uncharacterized protein